MMAVPSVHPLMKVVLYIPSEVFKGSVFFLQRSVCISIPVKLLMHESKMIFTALSVWLGPLLSVPMTSVYIIITNSLLS